jgi:hypothetical protein
MDPRGIATETVNVGGSASWHDAPRRATMNRISPLSTASLAMGLATDIV